MTWRVEVREGFNGQVAVLVAVAADPVPPVDVLVLLTGARDQQAAAAANHFLDFHDSDNQVIVVVVNVARLACEPVWMNVIAGS